VSEARQIVFILCTLVSFHFPGPYMIVHIKFEQAFYIESLKVLCLLVFKTSWVVFG